MAKCISLICSEGPQVLLFESVLSTDIFINGTKSVLLCKYCFK